MSVLKPEDFLFDELRIDVSVFTKNKWQFRFIFLEKGIVALPIEFKADIYPLVLDLLSESLAYVIKVYYGHKVPNDMKGVVNQLDLKEQERDIYLSILEMIQAGTSSEVLYELGNKYNLSEASIEDDVFTYSSKTLLKPYGKSTIEYYPSVKDFIVAKLVELYLLDKELKRCKNCNRYFVPSLRADAIYCDRPSPQKTDLTCKEYGNQKLWYLKIKEDEALKLCRNVYSAKQMLVKRNPDIESYKKAFDKFKQESVKWKSKYKAGLKTQEQFIEWLKSVKEKKTF